MCCANFIIIDEDLTISTINIKKQALSPFYCTKCNYWWQEQLYFCKYLANVKLHHERELEKLIQRQTYVYLNQIPCHPLSSLEDSRGFRIHLLWDISVYMNNFHVVVATSFHNYLLLEFPQWWRHISIFFSGPLGQKQNKTVQQKVQFKSGVLNLWAKTSRPNGPINNRCSLVT